MFKRFLAVIAFGVLALALVVPLTIGRAQGLGAALSLSTTTRFRFVNAANTSTALDVAVDGTKSTIAVGILPRTASKYDTIATAGNHTITLFQTNTTTPVGTPLTFNFAARTNYTLVLMPDLSWAEYTDTNPVPAAGTANARVINTSPNNNPVSLAVDATVPTEFTSIAYKASSAGYLNLTAVPHNLTIPGSSAPLKTFTFQAGHVYTIFVYWNPTKNLPVIVPENDVNFLTGTPTGTIVGTTTAVPTSGVQPTPLPTTPGSVGGSTGNSVPPDSVFIPVVIDRGRLR